MMGSTEGHPKERPAHQVTISQPFYLGTYEVTQGQWEAVMRNNPSTFGGGPNLPVENVSWKNVQAFIEKLNMMEGGSTYRLPTEAEWEYAARAGMTTAYSFGDDPEQLGAYAWYSSNSGSKTHPVGQLEPNPWGLYDMHGNVWEWVHDWYAKEYYQRSPARDPQGPDSGVGRVLRGGSWINAGGNARAAQRNAGAPGDRYGFYGFRLARGQASGR